MARLILRLICVKKRIIEGKCKEVEVGDGEKGKF